MCCAAAKPRPHRSKKKDRKRKGHAVGRNSVPTYTSVPSGRKLAPGVSVAYFTVAAFFAAAVISVVAFFAAADMSSDISLPAAIISSRVSV